MGFSSLDIYTFIVVLNRGPPEQIKSIIHDYILTAFVLTYPTVNAENISSLEFRRRNFVLLDESMAFHSKAMTMTQVNGKLFRSYMRSLMTPCL